MSQHFDQGINAKPIIVDTYCTRLYWYNQYFEAMINAYIETFIRQSAVIYGCLGRSSFCACIGENIINEISIAIEN